MSRCQWTILALWFAAVLLNVAGQSSNVTCLSTYSWSLNPLQQTPCLVGAALESVCGISTTVTPIPPDTHYLGPNSTEADPCHCNTVTYSLISACGACQNRTFTDWLTWSEDCPALMVGGFPRAIPSTVTVPSWAYLDVTQSNNTFNPVLAQQNASNTNTNTNTPVPTSSSGATTIPSATPSSTSANRSKSNAGAIAGGVVGGLVFLAIIALLGLWWFIRRRRNMVQKDISFDSGALVSGPSAMSQTMGSSVFGSTPVPSQSIYTSDMSSVHPGSPLTTSGIYTTIPPSRRSLDSVSPSVAQLGPGAQAYNIVPQGGFTGRPEI